MELAAARLTSLSPGALLTHLDQPLAMLDHGAADLPPRQHTMRATIDWSYQLLPDAARRLLRRLAVFAGGCTLEGAAAVDGQETEPATPVLPALTMLVESSLLQRTVGVDGDPRFTMLETVRQYAAEQLDASAETTAVRQRHLEWMLTRAHQAESHLRSGRRSDWLERLSPEIANIRLALRWAIEHGELETGRQLFTSLAWFWVLAGYHAESARWAEELQALPPGGTPTLGWATAGIAMAELSWDADHERRPHVHHAVVQAVEICRAAGDMRWLAAGLRWLIDYEPNPHAQWQLGDQCRAASARTGDPWEEAQTALHLGLAAANREELTVADAHFAAALRTFEILGDEWFAARCRFQRGLVALASGDLAQAERLLSESAPVLERAGDRRFHTWALDHLGEIALSGGHVERSRLLFEQSTSINRRAGDAARLAGSLLIRSIGLYWQGDHEQAARCVFESMRLNFDRNRPIGTAYGLYILAALCAERQPSRAARLLGAGEHLLRQGGVDIPQPYRAAQRQTTAAIQQLLGAERFAQEWAAGQAMSLVQLLSDDASERGTVGPGGAIRPVTRAQESLPAPAPDVGVAQGVVSQRELDVLRLLAAGKSNREIAAMLNITVNTVFRHVSNIFDKLGVTNRTEAAAYAYRHGLTP